MAKPVNSMSTSPLLHFLGCAMSPLVRSKAMWNIMTMDKEFCKSMDVSVGRSTACREDKSISGISVYSSKMLFLHGGSGPM